MHHRAFSKVPDERAKICEVAHDVAKRWSLKATTVIHYAEGIPAFSVFYPSFLGSPSPKIPDIQPAA